MKNFFSKITIVSLVFVIFITSINFAFATEVESEAKLDATDKVAIEGMMDEEAINGVYKLSDDDYKAYLPFIRYATDRIVLDKENTSNLGSLFSATSIEVTEKQTGIRCLFAADTVRINAPMEYAIVFAGENVVIDSKIEKSIIVFGGNTVTLTENAEIGGDIITFATNIQIGGKVGGSAICYSSSLNVSGTIENDLRANCEEINNLTDEGIKGKVYIETLNKNLNVADKYKDAIVKIIEKAENVKKVELSSIVFKCIVVSIVFTLMYVLFKKKTNMINDSMKLAKEHVLFFILSGSLSLLLLPLIVITLIIIALLNLEFIAIPLLMIYIAFLFTSGMLSTFIIGSIIISYAQDKYLNKENNFMNVGFAFLVFAVLFILAKLPVVGSYVTWGLVILSNGIVLLNIFKRKSLKS